MRWVLGSIKQTAAQWAAFFASKHRSTKRLKLAARTRVARQRPATRGRRSSTSRFLLLRAYSAGEKGIAVRA